VITVSNVSAALNGDQTVSGASGNTVNFVSSSITADIATAQSPNSAGRAAKVIVTNSKNPEAPAYSPVTSLGSGGSTYNVPGSLGYNADNAIDNIIASNENPS
jgi:hypothetical protein